MKRLLFLFLLLSTTSNLSAQDGKQNISTQINIAATVEQSIKLITVQNIRLSGIEPVNNQYTISPTISNNAGYMIAKGNPNAEIRITFQANQILNQINGDGIIRVNYQLSGNDIEEQLTSQILEVQNRSFTFNADGEFFIWIGGRIFIDQAKPGNYEGDFTIEIDYI